MCRCMKYLLVFVLLFTEILGLLLIVFVDLLLLVAPLQLRFAHSKLRLNNFLQVWGILEDWDLLCLLWFSLSSGHF